jgi:hypothetical protein
MSNFNLMRCVVKTESFCNLLQTVLLQITQRGHLKMVTYGEFGAVSPYIRDHFSRLPTACPNILTLFRHDL